MIPILSHNPPEPLTRRPKMGQFLDSDPAEAGISTRWVVMHCGRRANHRSSERPGVRGYSPTPTCHWYWTLQRRVCRFQRVPTTSDRNCVTKVESPFLHITYLA